jgi:predicted outer membrane repeat protein
MQFSILSWETRQNMGYLKFFCLFRAILDLRTSQISGLIQLGKLGSIPKNFPYHMSDTTLNFTNNKCYNLGGVLNAKYQTSVRFAQLQRSPTGHRGR